MIKKCKSSLPGHVRVIFELPASLWAHRIFLTGDFNNWHPHEIPLQQKRDGIWHATLELPTNRRYEFRYVIDGQEQTDYHADGFSSNAFGSQNSIVDTFQPEGEKPKLTPTSQLAVTESCLFASEGAAITQG